MQQGDAATTLPPPLPPPREELPEHILGEATVSNVLQTDAAELRLHWAATMQIVASKLWVTRIKPEHLTITRDRTTVEPLLYIKLDIPDLMPISSTVEFPVPPGIAHVTIAARVRIPQWDRFRLF